MSDWAVGLSTGCFWQTSIFDCVEDIRNSGFGRIEICSYPKHLDYHDVDLVRRASERIESLGLECYSFHAPFADHIDITSLDAGARSSALSEILQAVNAASLLKVRHFVVHPGPEKTILPEGEKFQRLENAVGVLGQLLNRCRELGMGLVLENMLPHLFAGRTRDLLWILASLNSTQVGVCLDTGHAHLWENLPYVAHKLSGHLWMVHMSDNHGQRDDHLPPGDGKIDWQKLLEQLARQHFSGTLMLEIRGFEDKKVTMEAARRGRHHIRELAHRLKIGV